MRLPRVSGMRIAGAACAAVALTAALGGWRLYVVYGGSMAPAIPPGSLALVQPLARPVRPGEIIAYRAGDRTVIHRVAAPAPRQAGMAWLTRGDANPVPDVQAVTAEDIVGRVVLVIPWLGVAVHHLAARAHLAAPLLAAVGLVLLLEGRGRTAALCLAALALTAPPAAPVGPARAAFATVRSAEANRLATAARDVLFAVNVVAGPARRPNAPREPVAAGRNRSLALDAGALARPKPWPLGGVRTGVTYIPAAFLLQGKEAVTIDLRVAPAPPGAVPWRDCGSLNPTWLEPPRGRYGLVTVRPARAIMFPGRSLPAALGFRLSSASPSGVFCGLILVGDPARRYGPSAVRPLAIPLRFEVPPR